MSTPDPYTPPATRDDLPAATAQAGLASRTDTILRWVGALGVAYLTVRVLSRPIPDLLTALMAVAIIGLWLYGFLRGGRKSHLAIALCMALSISLQAYYTHRAIADSESLPVSLSPHPWWDFARGIVPVVIVLGCAAALYLRAGRARSSAPSSSTSS